MLWITPAKILLVFSLVTQIYPSFPNATLPVQMNWVSVGKEPQEEGSCTHPKAGVCR